MFDVAEIRRLSACRALLCIAAAAAVVLQPGCDASASGSGTSVAGQPTMARAAALAVDATSATAAPTRAAVDFTIFALNALLVPLLDDTEPPRWVEPSLAFGCGERDVAVSVDGRPFVAGDPVPEPPFTLAWQLDDCSPLGTTMALTGTVDVAVLRRDRSDYIAEVRPHRLRVTSPEGASLLDSTFTARTPHGMTPDTTVHAIGRRTRIKG